MLAKFAGMHGMSFPSIFDLLTPCSSLSLKEFSASSLEEFCGFVGRKVSRNFRRVGICKELLIERHFEFEYTLKGVEYTLKRVEYVLNIDGSFLGHMSMY